MPSLYDFYSGAIERYSKTQERYGQAMFNHLVDIRPDLAAMIRGTDYDPFYVQDLKEERWRMFTRFLEKEWYVDEK
jgi:hypothetical protein